MIESDSMREILRLKQELMDGNYDQAIKLVSSLQTMYFDDRELVCSPTSYLWL